MAVHGAGLADALGGKLVAFGEWCAARHSLDYPALPDCWLMFDVYDKVEGRFWSTRRHDALTSAHGLVTVPRLSNGCYTLLHAGGAKGRTGALEQPLSRRCS